MTEKYTSSIVRIGTKGNVAGSGFLVAERQVITCAHVVAKVLGLPEDTPEIPQDDVCLDFPLIAASCELIGHVICWQPPRPDGSGDVAVLKLDEEVPEGVQTVKLVRPDNLWGHSFRVFGFPAGHDDGVWASGVLRDVLATGWIQIEEFATYRVEPGFSGAPVWDEALNCVVGMVVASETRLETRAAFILSATMLARAYPKIKPVSADFAKRMKNLSSDIILMKNSEIWEKYVSLDDNQLIDLVEKIKNDINEASPLSGNDFTKESLEQTEEDITNLIEVLKEIRAKGSEESKKIIWEIYFANSNVITKYKKDMRSANQKKFLSIERMRRLNFEY